MILVSAGPGLWCHIADDPRPYLGRLIDKPWAHVTIKLRNGYQRVIVADAEIDALSTGQAVALQVRPFDKPFTPLTVIATKTLAGDLSLRTIEVPDQWLGYIDFVARWVVVDVPVTSRRPSRDETGLALARVWAQRGTCARRQVGCVLFDEDGYQIGSGYNGPASGEPHCVEHPCAGVNYPSGTGLDVCSALHAEQNALLRCFDVRAIHTCYVTVSPCVFCVRLLLGTGTRRIVFAEDYPHPTCRGIWEGAGREWLKLEV